MSHDQQPYKNVYRHVVAGIGDGTYPVGSRLPSRAKLAALLDVGESTVQYAYRILQRDRVVRLEQGRGAYVLGPPEEERDLAGELDRLRHDVDRIMAHLGLV